MNDPINLAVERMRRGDLIQADAGASSYLEIITAAQDWHSKWGARIPTDAADELRIILLGIPTAAGKEGL